MDNMKKMPVAAVLFDLDGTLLDTIPLIVDSYLRTYRHHGLREHSREEVLTGIGLPLEEVFAREYGDKAPEYLQTYLRINEARLESSVGIFRGIIPMLQRLKEKGIPLGIVTAKRYENAKVSLDQFEILPYFGAIVTKFDTERHKPYPDPLLLGMQKLGISEPGKVLYVGDAIHDIMAAHNAGMRSAVVGWTEMPHEELNACKPDFWIPKAEDLPELIDYAV